MLTLRFNQNTYIKSFCRNLEKQCYKRELNFSTLKNNDDSFSNDLHEYKILVLQPGLVLIKKGLSQSAQVKLTEIALQFGSNQNNGFWKINEQGQTVLNQAPKAPHRGRIFDALINFPNIISELCQENLIRAAHVDKTIKLINPTHLIQLYYKTLAESPRDGYIPWHQDKDANDGDDDKPVVSFTLGDSCDFLVCNNKPTISSDHPFSNPKNLAHRILFESGDILIFGGPSRYIHHSIHKIYNKSAPDFLPLQDARLNFTFRFAPKIRGKEEIFSSENFKSVYHTNKL